MRVQKMKTQKAKRERYVSKPDKLERQRQRQAKRQQYQMLTG